MKIYLDKKMNNKKYIIKKVKDKFYTIYVEKPTFDNILVLPISDADFAFTSRKKESEMFFSYNGILQTETIDLFIDDSFLDNLTFEESIYITKRGEFITIATSPFKNFEYDIIFDSENIK